MSVSAVGLGGFELGPSEGEKPDVDRATRVIETALESGVNWLDTSENYLHTRNESLIGAALGRARGEILVATKVAPRAALTGRGSGSATTRFILRAVTVCAGSDASRSTSTSCTCPTTRGFRSKRHGAQWQNSWMPG